MKYIQVVPFELTRRWEKIESEKSVHDHLIMTEIKRKEVIYLNIDQIKYISPINETGFCEIVLLNDEKILSLQPLYRILEEINKANNL
jgi:hypothetical protein